METPAPSTTRKRLTAVLVLFCVVALLQLALLFQRQVRAEREANVNRPALSSFGDRIRAWLIPRKPAPVSIPANRAWEPADDFEQMHAQINRMFDLAFREITPIPSKTPAAASNSTTSGSSAFLFPAQNIHRMQQQIDALFASATRDFQRWPAGFEDGWNTLDVTPSMTVEEGPDAYDIKIHIPDVAKPDIHVSLEGNVLTVVAGREEAAAHPARMTNVTWQAQRSSHFERRIRLPRATSETETVRAVYEDNVLHVTVPKAEAPELTPSRIRVI